MAVFICCADESSDQNPRKNYFYGGFAAPVDEWEHSFAPAWNRRVLLGPPRIPHLHVTDFMTVRGRKTLGITEHDATRRLNVAAQLIRKHRKLIPLMWCAEVASFDAIKALAPRKRHTGLEQPDYLSFLAFAHLTLQWLYQHRRDDVDRVDFWVEQNDKISHRIGGFHGRLRESLTGVGLDHLAALVGGFQEVCKERIPAQAADMLCWHARNNKAGRLTEAQGRRYNRMIKGREGCIIDDGDTNFLGKLRERVQLKIAGV